MHKERDSKPDQLQLFLLRIITVTMLVNTGSMTFLNTHSDFAAVVLFIYLQLLQQCVFNMWAYSYNAAFNKALIKPHSSANSTRVVKIWAII